MSERGKDDGSKATPNLPLSARALLSRQRNAGVMSGPGRLPSLRPARDLSLGATPKLNLASKFSKRTFTPTIPTRRIKEEPKDQDSFSKDSSPNRRQFNQGGEGQGRGRGRGRGNRAKSDIVKSQSVFSMGPAEKSRTGQSTPSVSFTGGDRKDSKSTKSSATKEKKLEYDDEESKKILQMLQTEDDDTENENTEFGMAPVTIPLSSFSLRIKEAEGNKNLPIKEEPMDVDMEDCEAKKPIKPKPVVQKPSVEPQHFKPTCSSLFNTSSESTEDKLIFIQLPDKLPIKATTPVAQAKGGSSEGEAPDESTTDKTKGIENCDLSLKDVSEGYIGKLQVLKSGTTRLVLGDVTLDVAMGTSCSFLQELVTVHTEEDRSDLTVLGPVKHRIICTPDFEQLLTAR